MENIRSPHSLKPEEFAEIMEIEEVRHRWGITDETTIEEFESQVYAVRFEFRSGSPGFNGDFYILQPEYLLGIPPVCIYRDRMLGLTLELYREGCVCGRSISTEEE
jgi:hypothetical protein